jgi:hypothetical protein
LRNAPKTIITVTVYSLLVLIALTGCEHKQPDEKSNLSKFIWGNHLTGKTVENLAIRSTLTGVIYPYHVYLPASYNTSEKTYPVIYALDGQWNFKGFTDLIDKDQRDIILISIEEGPKASGRRSIDYRLPGVKTYIEFFRQEFIPLIESKYRIDSNHRSFQGTSFGGIAATAFMFLDDAESPLFENYIAYDASMWDSPELLSGLIDARLAKNHPLKVKMFLTTALPLGNHISVKGFMKDLEERNIEGLNIDHRSYWVPHDGIAWESFENTLISIFGVAK